MVWIRMQCKESAVIRANLDSVRLLLLDISGCGRLMPSVLSLEPRGDGVYHYQLEAFSNGAISMAPDYEARFDSSDPAAIRWEPYGEHDFRSWGVFHSTVGPVADESVVEIDTRAEADVPIDRVLIPLVEPFARRFMREVTAGFLANIKQVAESGGVPASHGPPAVSGMPNGGGK